MRSWQAFGFDRGEVIVLGASSLAHAAIGFLPLFGGPGYEASLALGLILPLPVAAHAAARAVRERRDGASDDPLVATLGRACRFALWVVAAQLVVLLAHGARVGFCGPGQGLLLFALGPAAGALMAAAWGTLAGLASVALGRGRALAVGLALAGPIGSILVSVGRFYTSPMVFAFDPFVGFFAGTLYDTVIDAVPRLVTYRAGSAASLLALVSSCAALGTGAARPALQRLRQRWGRTTLAVLFAAASAGVAAAGPALGHWQTDASIRRELGHRLESERCEVVYASGIWPERAALLGRECDAHVAAHEAYFEAAHPGKITVFAFASARQKGWLMGAWNTYIAKPWRHEVYVQSDNFPHPVLSHELAHVVAGTFGRGPLAVAGPLGGWLPDPGRIEGFAVAAAPPEDSDYTLLEWTRALKELGLLPRLSSLFKLSFLGQNSSTGYTVAGAVVDWLRTRHGPAALRAWYSGASVEAAFGGETLDQLSVAFAADLERLVVPDRILELARARFDRPAIFGRRCPHVVDELLVEAAAAYEGFDFEAATAAYERGLRLDPANFSARMGLAACAERSGATAEARARYEVMARDPGLSRVQRASALERLGDLALLAGEDERAAEHYAAAERDAYDEHRARTIAVKRQALDDPAGRAAILALLVGDARFGSDLPHATAELGEWSATAPQNGLADYLIGKNLYSRARWRDSRQRLSRSLERPVPLESVRREALRTFIFASCALDEREAAARAVRQYLVDPGLSSARKNGMQRFAESCRPSAP